MCDRLNATAVTVQVRRATESTSALNARDRLGRMHSLMHSQIPQFSERLVTSITDQCPRSHAVLPVSGSVSSQSGNRTELFVAYGTRPAALPVDAARMRGHVVLPAETATARRARVQRRRLRRVSALVSAQVRLHRKLGGTSRTLVTSGVACTDHLVVLQTVLVGKASSARAARVRTQLDMRAVTVSTESPQRRERGTTQLTQIHRRPVVVMAMHTQQVLVK